MNVLSLFDGMSCGRIALERAGVRVDNYFSSEIDKYAIQIADKNYPQDKINRLGNVVNVESWMLPEIDLLIGGSPCQGFSFAGKQLNFQDERSKLFFEYVRLIDECKPKYFLLENVKMKKEYQDVITKYLGVEPILINSNLVSAQNRPRLYWTNIPNVRQPDDKDISLKDILEDVPFRPLKPFMDGLYGGVKRKDKCKLLSSKKANCLTTSKTHTNQYYLSDCKTQMRNLTEVEFERLQTVPDNYTKGVVSGQRYRQLGNGWTIDVIAHIFKGLK
jgi:DNA (cytosine-5)-methyltransferase 3A